MGEIPVRDDADDEEHPASLLDGVVELRFDEDRSPIVVITEEAPFTSQDVVLGDEEPAAAETVELELRWAVLGASTVLALLSVSLSAAGLLQTTGSSPAAIAGRLLHGLVLLGGAYGTFALYADATYLSRSEKRWSPSPWRYLVPGWIVVGGYLLWQFSAADPTALSTPALIGITLVAAALSAVPTAPVYLYNRHRRIGLLAE